MTDHRARPVHSAHHLRLDLGMESFRVITGALRRDAARLTAAADRLTAAGEFPTLAASYRDRAATARDIRRSLVLARIALEQQEG